MMNKAYPLKPFRIKSMATLCEIMRHYPLATLFSGEAGQAHITLLPLVLKGSTRQDLRLLGHLDQNNAHTEKIRPGEPISFLFQGPNAYASPDIYPSRQLPGWLYVTVKGDGEIESRLTQTELRALLIESTQTFGATNQQFNLDAQDKRIDMFIGGIVGFSIKITQISGIAKLAQDKGRADALLAQDYLSSLNNKASSALLERLLEETL